MVFKDNWAEQMEGEPPASCATYITANEHFIRAIDEILATSKNSEEVQERLVKLRKERSDFVDYANEHLP